MSFTELQNGLKEAMKARDTQRMEAIKTLIAAVKKAAIDAGTRDDITDELVDSVILKELKVAKEQVDTCPAEAAEQLAEYKKEYKLKDDPRLIGYKSAGDGDKCFGAKLRRMSLDELPQILVNILLLGNMSVVGPRPIVESELKENYTPEEQKLLLSVKPGLTGYWQAYARNNAGYANGERQKMELYYISNRSFGLDIKIIFKTIITVLKRSGAK